MAVSSSFNWTDFLISPPLTPPFRHRGGVSAFGVRRWRDQLSQVQGVTDDLPSTHSGVDLKPVRADDNGAVYAAHWGQIVRVDQDFNNDGTLKQETLVLLCEPPDAGIVFNYLHILRSVLLPGGQASSGVQSGDRVRKGQLLGFISPNNSDPHLHFEMRILSNTSPAVPIDNQRPVDTFAIDPTAMLYRFEANRWPRARDQEALFLMGFERLCPDFPVAHPAMALQAQGRRGNVSQRLAARGVARGQTKRDFGRLPACRARD